MVSSHAPPAGLLHLALSGAPLVGTRPLERRAGFSDKLDVKSF